MRVHTSTFIDVMKFNHFCTSDKEAITISRMRHVYESALMNFSRERN